MNPENTNKGNFQTFGTTTVRIMKNIGSGARVAEIRPKGRPAFRVPVELLSMTAGKDAWMRKIQVRCAGCRTPYAAEDLYGAGYCPGCMDAIDEENERLNGGNSK